MNDNFRLSMLSLLLVFGTMLATPEAKAQEINTLDPVHRLKIATTVSIPLPTITVQTQENGQGASLLVDSEKVLTIYSAAGGLSPEQRAQKVQERLEQFLKYDGNPRDIKPGLEGGQVVIRAGKDVLVTLDNETAKKENKNTRQVAFEWANTLRSQLGAEALERNPVLIASRGFVPILPDMGNVRGVLRGRASWYGPGFNGRRTASGERFNMMALTAAHRTLPFNTLIRVTNNRTGQSAIVRVNDRGPYSGGRIIDLSKGAAKAVGMLSSGTASVTLEVLE